MSMMRYEFMSLTAQVQVTAEEMRDALIATVSEWAAKQLSAGYNDEYMMHRFLDERPEWDKPGLYDLIESEIERVKGLCLRG